MSTKRQLIALALFATLAACGGPGGNSAVPVAQPAGESHTEIGSHTVYYNAIATDQLPADVARSYDIARSKNRAMLNVAIQRTTDQVAVPADIAVKTVNLTGQAKTINMRRINEQDAIYYIGVTPVANREVLIFELTITPEGETQSHSVKFQREFYTDG
jgi:hypothetical protein